VVDRRTMLRATAAGLAGLTLGATFPTTTTVVFHGDSITAAGRDGRTGGPNDATGLGAGYPFLIAAPVLQHAARDAWRFFNRARDGAKVPDLASHWAADVLALRPDILSVLVGVNDYWHRRRGYTGTAADYETGLTDLLRSTRRALPAVRLLVLEPFVLRCGAVDASWFPAFDERRAAAARSAEQARATFVPLQQAFDQAAARTGAAYWAPDGVHPTPAGHALIAERWREVVGIV
jgi:lysophospholipase L1-like esterase